MAIYKLKYSAAVFCGSRDKKQDVFLADGSISGIETRDDELTSGECLTDRVSVFAVCDGIGSFESSGRIAELALNIIKQEQAVFSEKNPSPSAESVREMIMKALELASSQAREFCRSKSFEGSCTLSAVVFFGGFYMTVNLGDSPIYKIRAGEALELYECHNLAGFRRLIGLPVTEGDKSVLLHHLTEKEITVAERSGELSDGDCFIICTDGVTDCYSVQQLIDETSENKRADDFTRTAAERDNSDNGTMIRIDVSIEEG